MSDGKLTELEALERLIANDARNLAAIRKNERLYMAADVARIAADCALRYVRALRLLEDGLEEGETFDEAYINLMIAAELWAARRA